MDKEKVTRRKLSLKDHVAELDRKISRQEKATLALRARRANLLAEHRARIEAQNTLLQELGQ